jgi:NitT/TauT family transport system ATP-binding protein
VSARIDVRDLTVRFPGSGKPVDALGPLRFLIEPGEFVSVIGPSGCGKTTLARVLSTLVDPSEGEVSVRSDSGGLPRVALVPQEFSLLPWKTALQNIVYGLYGTRFATNAERVQRAMDWLERMGLIEFANEYPDNLSGGMKQRVAIARALATTPDLLVMDEPFASLDAQTRENMQEELLETQEYSSITTLFITHSLEEAIILSDRVLVLSKRPGTLVMDKVVSLPRTTDARSPTSEKFTIIRKELRQLLREQGDPLNVKIGEKA